MSIIRPQGATHIDIASRYYKAGEELNWLRWFRGKWLDVGTLAKGTLTPLPAVEAYQLPTLDPVQTAGYGVEAAPAPAPAPAPHYAPMKPSMADNWGTCGQAPSLPEPVAVGFAHYFTKYQFVGSRITCNPPPLDTDQDVLVLVRIGNLAVMELKILEAGFVKEGSLPAEMALDADKNNVFHSYRKGDMNYIVTTDKAFYQRFSTATELARKYNLMEKSDRIQLFQAVLYGKWWA